MVDRVNAARDRAGVRKLRTMPVLDRSARGYANRLMSLDAFSHRSRLPTPGGIVRTGEVLAVSGGRDDAVRRTLRMWLSSGAHRAILLDPAMNRIGAGISKGSFGGRSSAIWVIQVGAR